MASDLVAFLRACLDDDESAALGAKGSTLGRWQQDDGPPEDIVLYDKSGKLTMGQARHIARHDPARVLAEVAFKRELITLWETAKRNAALPNPEGVPVYYPAAFVNGCASALGYAIKLAAAPYAAVEGYRPEWAPDAG